MLIETAIKLIEGVTFFPEWGFTATDHSKRFEGTILVRIEYDTRETNRVNAENGYPEKIRAHASFPIVVGAMHRDVEVYRALTTAIMKVWEHETREALRVKATGWAPFHPHALGGMRTWLDTEDQRPELLPDLQFGIG